MEIGEYNNLKVNRFTENGAYLIDELENEVLLPNKYVSDDLSEEDMVKVFIYTDSLDRIIATTLTPFSTRNQFACLSVKDVNRFGVFLDWGLEKDLFVPFSEQEKKMRPGQWCLSYTYLDTITKRLVASTKIHRFVDRDLGNLEEGQEVDLIIGETTINGIRVIVNQKHLGLIYENETFEELLKGSERKGYIKQIRPDDKLDISIRKTGLESLEEGAEKIINILKQNNGVLLLHDKSTPEEIQSTLGMSKKHFKKSLGTLYKKRLINLADQRISLTEFD